jgi:UDP-N-acetylmuramoyl-L-alanyl-D-glutamate--2,6-diaminopimelate ligase
MRAFELTQLLGGGLSGLEPHVQIDLKGLCSDSRHVAPGSLFVAIPGASGDGHQFVPSAFAAGAVCAVVERPEVLNGKPGIVVTNTRLALSRLAAALNGFPSRELLCFGITGTNGKTTTNWMIFHALSYLGLVSYRIGTLGTAVSGQSPESSSLTTPDPLSVHSGLRSALAHGAKACVMEASSHALDQRRIDDIEFDVGVFTNLTRDHLDYHQSMQAYAVAKFRLMQLVSASRKSTKAAVINVDDCVGAEWQKQLADLGLRDFSFGRGASASVRLANFTQSLQASEITLVWNAQVFKLHSPFIGEHNAENMAAAFAALVAAGFRAEDVARALAACPQVPGRLESVGNSEVGVFVDYAHTPDALERALCAIRPLSSGTLWAVFGCGGDRDRGKRPQMAAIASKFADALVVTSDNPRTENPHAIIADILSQGVEARITEVDRREAIKLTLSLARPGDLILIAGKGHEDYQVIGTKKEHFSDQEVVREVMQR